MYFLYCPIENLVSLKDKIDNKLSIFAVCDATCISLSCIFQNTLSIKGNYLDLLFCEKAYLNTHSASCCWRNGFSTVNRVFRLTVRASVVALLCDMGSYVIGTISHIKSRVFQ